MCENNLMSNNNKKIHTLVQSTLAAKGHAETCLYVQGMW